VIGVELPASSFAACRYRKLPGEGISATAIAAKDMIPRIIIFLIKKLPQFPFSSASYKSVEFCFTAPEPIIKHSQKIQVSGGKIARLDIFQKILISCYWTAV
jgi:hypothetical protein